MTPLRQDIADARREYDAIRYPGDISRQLLPARMRIRWKNWLIFSGLSASGVAAAAVVAAMMLRPLLMPAVSKSSPYLQIVKNIPLASELEVAIHSLPDVMPSRSEPAEGFRVPIWDDLQWPDLFPSSEHA